MSSPFIGEIRIFGGTFAPRNYAYCNGQILTVSQNSALYSLLGATFGGNGSSTFGLPDLRGRVPVNQGAGPGLSAYSRGQTGGGETVTLTVTQLPGHTHVTQGDTSGGALAAPVAGAIWSSVPRGHPAPYASSGTPVAMSAAAVAPTGGGLAHNNRSPYQAVAFIIAIMGVYPSRS